MTNYDEAFDVLIGLAVFVGLVMFLVVYNQAISASHNQIIDIRDLNIYQQSDCDSKGGGYLSFEKKQGCIIFYPNYNNIKY